MDEQAPAVPRRGGSRHQLKTAQWPKLDQLAWAKCTTPGDALEPGAPASRWAPATQRNVAKAYGRWLTWLIDTDQLDPVQTPDKRVTRERIVAYVDRLRSEVISTTVFSYIQHLALGLSAMAPTAAWGWLWDIAHRLKAIAVPSDRKRGRLVPARDLVLFGLELMKRADANFVLPASKRAANYRDGLMIALLAMRPFRLRNFRSIEIGQHLFMQGGAYYLRFHANELKTRKTKRGIEVPFPKGLTTFLETYLEVYRPVLMAEKHIVEFSDEETPATSALWLSVKGLHLSEVSIRNRMLELTEGKFSKRINPHLFRDYAATSIAEQDPEHSRIIMAILGHTTLDTSDRYYNQATSAKASLTYQQQLLAMRQKNAKLMRQRRRQGCQAEV